MDHLEFAALESALLDGSPSERRWMRWADKVEAILGHHLDGNQYTGAGDPDDGFCMDYAYDAWKRGETPAQHASAIKARPAYQAFLARGGFAQ